MKVCPYTKYINKCKIKKEEEEKYLQTLGRILEVGVLPYSKELCSDSLRCDFLQARNRLLLLIPLTVLSAVPGIL